MGSINEIKNNIDYLEKEDIISVCDQMDTVCGRLKKITESFLMFSQLEAFDSSPAQKEELRADRTDEPGAILTDLVENLAQKYDRLNDIVKENEVSECAVAISTEYFNKLLEEMVDNAFKFSKQGQKVYFNTEIDSKQPHLLTITIRDEGPGMTLEQIKSIAKLNQFDREQNEQQGMGMGIPIARKIAEIHNGSLTLESNSETIGVKICAQIPLYKD